MLDDILKSAEHKMGRAVEILSQDLQSVRTGRASPALLDRIQVDYYGSPTPLNGSGVPPETGIRHSLDSPPRFEEKTISLLSPVQVSPLSIRQSEVKRRGWPPVIGITYRSAARKPAPAA